MTKANGNKVSWQSLHEELKEQSKEREAMEGRLVEAFASGCGAIHDDLNRYIGTNDARVKCVEVDIVGLKVADRKWGGVVGLFAAGVAGLGAWLGQR
jgi:hypothetical protein